MKKRERAMESEKKERNSIPFLNIISMKASFITFAYTTTTQFENGFL